VTVPFGIDVSSWNHVGSWQQAKGDGVELGISKATEGLDFTDPSYVDNWQGSSILTARIAYHFGHPSHNPIDEAAHFLSVATFGPADWPMLDLESTDGLGFAHAAAWAQAWCQYVEDRTGKAPFFYSYSAFIASMGVAANALTAFPLYLAAYQAAAPSPSPWAKWSIWQDTSSGQVAGVYGTVDLDVLAPGELALLAPAHFPGVGGHITLNKPASGMAFSPTGKGYLIVGQDGGVFAFGDASYHKSLPEIGVVPSAPIVGITVTPDGGGYWLAGADGGVFAFGDASPFGSMGGHHLNAPVVGIVGSPSGKGYALVGADGAVFAYGDAPFLGSAA
jgi:GH25 family lysozyme M1 (1,4-beta-N-acetylmuramidase)